MNPRHLPAALTAAILVLALASSLAAAQAPVLEEGVTDSTPEAMAATLGTAFTYQGQLLKNYAPVNGACDFIFTLWDEPTFGRQVGAAVGKSPVTVTGGLFTVPDLDFGSAAFKGSARWLEVEVKCGDLSYTKIGTRQALTATPYALYAAGNWALSGNALTTPGAQYLGTSDEQALELKVNAARALRIEPNSTTPNLIGGSSANTSAAGVVGVTIGGGGNTNATCGFEPAYDCWNTATASYATVSGGWANDATAASSAIGGGHNNTASGVYATVAGGNSNRATAGYATIGGGGKSDPLLPSTANRVTDEYGTVGGGGDNQAGDGDTVTTNSTYATVAGGLSNTASSFAASVGGGSDNIASHLRATVAGGGYNTASGNSSTVGGGYGNTASAVSATVGGGQEGAAEADYSTIGGGFSNTAGAAYSTIAGGDVNRVTDNYGAVGGGEDNLAGDTSASPTNAMHATVGGGLGNEARAGSATIGGGNSNSAGALAATVGGGYDNAATGPYSTIPGGREALAVEYGQQAYASGSFAAPGDAQASLFVLRGQTSTGDWAPLYLDGSMKKIARQPGRAMAVDILLVASSSSGDSAAWRASGVIDGNTAQLNGQSLGADTGASGWLFTWALEEDSWTLEVRGGSGVNVRWVASVRAAEVGW